MSSLGGRRIWAFLATAAIDAVLLVFALLSAYALRFNFAIPPHHLAVMPMVFAFTIALELALLAVFDYRDSPSWRHIPGSDVPRLLAPLATASAVSLACRAVFGYSSIRFYAPISVNLMNLPVAICALAGVRWLRRIVAKRGDGITDILKRGEIPVSTFAAHRKFLEGRRILVTGAGGSIGSEIARQVLAAGPERLVLVERGELALFDISRELAASPNAVALRRHLADVGDGPRMSRILAAEKPDIVFHAAAYKHVPLMEENPCEAIGNNVFGTVSLARQCAAADVGTFVLLSSDKAVEPSSVMGATKRVCELALMSMNGGTTRFTAVRFGNVLGSTGSVVPVFREQIRRGGPVTVTHPDMERFFMTIPEAASLTLVAAAMAADRPGRAFVLDMGEPVKITELAENMIRLAGKIPGLDVKIAFTGVRPGEKMQERLTTDAETLEATGDNRISCFVIEPPAQGALDSLLATLRNAVDSGDVESARTALMAFVKGAAT